MSLIYWFADFQPNYHHINMASTVDTFFCSVRKRNTLLRLHPWQNISLLILYANYSVQGELACFSRLRLAQGETLLPGGLGLAPLHFHKLHIYGSSWWISAESYRPFHCERNMHRLFYSCLVFCILIKISWNFVYFLPFSYRLMAEDVLVKTSSDFYQLL